VLAGAEGEQMVRNLQGARFTVDEKLAAAEIRLFLGSAPLRAGAMGGSDDDDDEEESDGDEDMSGSGSDEEESGSGSGEEESGSGSESDDNDGGEASSSGGEDDEEEAGAAAKALRRGMPRGVAAKGSGGGGGRQRRAAVFGAGQREAPPSDEEEDDGDGSGSGEDAEDWVGAAGRGRRSAAGGSGSDDDEDGSSGSGDEEDEDDDEGLGAAARWKRGMMTRASVLFAERGADVESYIYSQRAVAGAPGEAQLGDGEEEGAAGGSRRGSGGGAGARFDDGGADSDDDGELFTLRKDRVEKAAGRGGAASALAAIDGLDTSRVVPDAAALAAWDAAGAVEALRNRFVTGDWAEGKRRAEATPGEEEGGSDDDGDVFGEFEDLETGVKFGGGDDEVSRAARKAIADAGAEALRAKKLAKKAAFDAAYDGGADGLGSDVDEPGGGGGEPGAPAERQGAAHTKEETFYDHVKRGMAAREALDALAPATRLAMEGHRPGAYVRLRFKGAPPAFFALPRRSRSSPTVQPAAAMPSPYFCAAIFPPRSLKPCPYPETNPQTLQNPGNQASPVRWRNASTRARRCWWAAWGRASRSWATCGCASSATAGCGGWPPPLRCPPMLPPLRRPHTAASSPPSHSLLTNFSPKPF
jgi:ribosome biogenesis protein BMS1